MIQAVSGALDYIAEMNKKRLYPLLIAALVVLLFVLQKFGSSSDASKDYRNISKLIYTKHARCRMGCRFIDEREVKEVIEKGKLNESKSGRSKQNDDTYALEGWSSDDQHIRVVVSPEDDGLLVITVIDLGKDWPCNCN